MVVQREYMMIIAPTGTVTLNGSGPISGTVIANEFNMSGASLTYSKDVDTTGFPSGASAATADPDPEDIISSGAIIEN